MKTLKTSSDGKHFAAAEAGPWKGLREQWREAAVSLGATTWQYVTPVPRWFPAGIASVMWPCPQANARCSAHTDASTSTLPETARCPRPAPRSRKAVRRV